MNGVKRDNYSFCAELLNENAPNFQVGCGMGLIYMKLNNKKRLRFCIMLHEHNVCAA